MRKLRIMHVWGPCSISCTLAKKMDELYDTESLVLALKEWDRYGHIVYGEVWDTHLYLFLPRMLLKARNYDIIHLHDRDVYLPYLRRLYPVKKLIIQYHGSAIRNRWEEKKPLWKKADSILVTTPDLLEGGPDNAILLNNCVDTEMFTPKTPHVGRALTRTYKADEEAEGLADAHGLKLDILRKLVPYLYMPNILGRYEYYIDVKRNPRGDDLLTRNGVLSMTGLQALACGCKVLDSDGVIYESLPDRNQPEYAVKRLHSIYEKMI